MTAADNLAAALLTLEHEGRTTPCQHPQSWHLWTSDDRAEREAATFRCAGCPVLELCHAAAEEDRTRFHVWAGVDRSGGPR